MRISIVDGWRGFFLIFMTVTHVNETFGALIGKLNHHAVGWVEDAQGFVFISGFVTALTCAKVLAAHGPAALDAKVGDRVAALHRSHAALVLTFLIAALSIPGAAMMPSLAPYAGQPAAFATASLLLVTASNDMGILPMYLYFMFATPFVLRWLHRGRAAPVLAASLALWLLGQTGLVHLAGLWGEDQLAAIGAPIRLGLYFNIFGWQILFVAGLFFGSRYSQGRLDLGWLRERQHEVGFVVALAGIVALGVFRRLVFDRWVSPEFSAHFLAANQRQDLPLIYLGAFALDLYAVAWLFVAGPTSRFAVLRRVAGTLQWLFSRRFLGFLGEHSLEVFVFHLLLVYLVSCWFGLHPAGVVAANLYVVACVALLYVPAWWHARQVRDVRAQALPA